MANIIGTQGPDVLEGTDESDSIFGLGADDSILESGAGNDTIDGGLGFDNIQLWRDYADTGARINMTDGTISTLSGGSDNDLFTNIEMIVGSSRSDVYDASGFGYTPGARNITDYFLTNHIRPLRGDDVITGNGRTMLRLGSNGEDMGVNVNLKEGWARSEYIGDNTILGGVNGIEGTRFADNIVLGDPAGDYFEVYRATNGNDTIDGGTGFDRAEYNRVEMDSAGLRVDLGNGTVAGKADGSIDVLRNILGVRGAYTNDVFDATGYSLTSPNKSQPFYPLIPLMNQFEGLSGNDTILGNNYTIARYSSAASGVRVDLKAGTASSLQTNDAANVGVDTLSGVFGVYGSAHNDLLLGGNSANDQYESFRGSGGNDTIDGGSGWDLAQFPGRGDLWTEYAGEIRFAVDTAGNRIFDTGIIINMASGSVSGSDYISDASMRGVEAISGSPNDDTYDARGFGASSLNSGSVGGINEFEGGYGNDIVIGNGDTRIGFMSARAPVTVDFSKGQASSSQYLLDGSDPALVGVDNFSGVNAVHASRYADTLIGSGAAEIYFGAAGNDIIRGNGGADLAVYQGARSQYSVSSTTVGNGQTVISIVDQVTDRDGRDTLYDVTRIQFSDQTVAYDVGIDDVAAEAYRIYKAAFNRTPDLPGLGYWIEQMDKGASLTDVAGGFLQSREFINDNGPNLSDAEFINAMYFNVLGRGADQSGYDYWLTQISNGLGRADILSYFSESAENIANVEAAISDGITYQPTEAYPIAGLFLV